MRNYNFVLVVGWSWNVNLKIDTQPMTMTTLLHSECESTNFSKKIQLEKIIKTLACKSRNDPEELFSEYTYILTFINLFKHSSLKI